VVRVFFKISVLIFFILFLLSGQVAYAQMEERLFTTDYQIDSLQKGQLSIEMDNLSFYKNNEYGSTIQKGYTLPGFWLQLKAVYYPLTNLKLEVGAHSTWFWGTTRYPAIAYKNSIPTLNGKDYYNIVHVLPYFRANLALSNNVSVVLGDIYGGANHRLIDPLFNPELNLSTDPEKGVQLLYKTKWLDFDMWLDWTSFIYNRDTIQESFVAGGSARIKFNSPESRFHVYLPVQGLAYHKGGELDITDTNIQTIMNGAFGAGLRWNVKGRVIEYVNAEAYMTGYVFPKGGTSYFDRGRGYYSKIAVQLKDFNINTSYWSSGNFFSVFGNAFYSTISTKLDDMIYYNPKMLNFNVDYSRVLGKGFAFGVKAEAYYYVSGKMYSLKTGAFEPSPFGKNANFSVGVYLRLNPSFLIKQF
jgi:hypothetical protein